MWKLSDKDLFKGELSRRALSCAASYAVCTEQGLALGVFRYCRQAYCLTCRLIDKFHQALCDGRGEEKKKERLDISYCVACVP